MIPIIMSGGSGTRLWPLSRQEKPKQFIELFGSSLQELTIQRTLLFGSPWILTVKDLEILSRRILTKLNQPQNQIILEPLPRNTAAAIGLLCLIFQRSGKESEIVGVFPADHLIENVDTFHKALWLAHDYAEKNQVVTLGIRPHFPSTGYGYIETMKPHTSHSKEYLEGRVVKRFCEKPNLETAQHFMEDGNYFWNAGIFIFKIGTMIHHLNQWMPELWKALQTIDRDLSNIEKVYSSLSSVSIDYGVMEFVKEQICIPCEMGWSDIGSWDEVARILSNQKQKYHFEINCEDNWILGDKDKAYGLIKVSDLIVVDTDDGLLITKKGETQLVKNLIEELKPQGFLHEKKSEVRPWGAFSVLHNDEKFKVKKISVEKGSQLSYQSHHHRSEHWIVLSGVGEVILDDQTISVRAGTHVFIPQKAKHRIRNLGDAVLEFVEVQVGTYFGEGDIVRYQDDYGR